MIRWILLTVLSVLLLIGRVNYSGKKRGKEECGNWLRNDAAMKRKLAPFWCSFSTWSLLQSTLAKTQRRTESPEEYYKNVLPYLLMRCSLAALPMFCSFSLFHFFVMFSLPICFFVGRFPSLLHVYLLRKSHARNFWFWFCIFFLFNFFLPNIFILNLRVSFCFQMIHLCFRT